MSRAVITIGVFDGVHAGHAALVARARQLADANRAAVVAMAFDPHPVTRLRPEAAPARLTTFEQRRRLLMEAGADAVDRLEPTESLLSQSPGNFVEWIGRRWRVAGFVEGPDFRFGRGRSGDVEFLAHYGARAGFGVEIVEPVSVTLTDHTMATASSTLVRWLLAQGRAGDAAQVLGRPYELEGTVVPGDRRGRTIGFPTANLSTECLIPADGVYAGEAVLEDERVFPAAISIGTKPTFGAGGRAVEAYLLDAPREGTAIRGLPEYGWPLRLRIKGWVRQQLRFETPSSLVEQMHLDCCRVRDRGAAAGADVQEGAPA